MTVYVDDARIPARVGRLDARWSHLFADSREELHEFAERRLSLRRSWFQDPVVVGTPRARLGSRAAENWHYDVTEVKRRQAIATGAVAVTGREAAVIVSVRYAANLGVAPNVIPFEAWRLGLVSPLAITTALDLRELYGPDVDRACGVDEPAVDMWEAAQLYPSWVQLEALAALTGFPVLFFTTHRRAPAGGFLCRRGRSRGCEEIPAWTGPLAFPREVVARCPGTRWHEPVGQLAFDLDPLNG